MFSSGSSSGDSGFSDAASEVCSTGEGTDASSGKEVGDSGSSDSGGGFMGDSSKSESSSSVDVPAEVSGEVLEESMTDLERSELSSRQNEVFVDVDEGWFDDAHEEASIEVGE